MDTKNILVEPYEHIIIFEEEKYKKERKESWWGREMSLFHVVFSCLIEFV